jgi:RNA polymerase sigma-70 factor (ECF subfamily)
MNDAAPDSAETVRLLDLARGGDRRAFDELFARHRPYLRQVIELRLDPRLAARLDPSDVIQEAHLEAYRRLDDYLRRRPMAFRLWLRKTAQERLQMLHRQHLGAARRAVARERALPDRSSLLLAERLIAGGPTPEQQFDLEEAARSVRQALDELSEDDREIVIMRNLEGLTNQEAAQVLQIEPATASQRYGRALLRLRKVLADHGLLESDP